MATCELPPKDKRAQAKKVGDDLVRNYGKKKFYTVDEVKAANQRTLILPDFWCWSHAMFNSHPDFDAYHQAIGETCDYVLMKSKMLNAITAGDDASWFNLDFDFDLSWLDFPDIDWSIFDFFDW